MILKWNNVRVIVPLDPWEGEKYTKLVTKEDCTTNIGHIYQLKTKESDFFEPTTKRKLNWEHANSCSLD